MSNIERYRKENAELMPEVLDFLNGRTEVKTVDLQRRFLMGYVKTAVLMDMLEERGYVGSYKPAQPRKVLI